jgi:hypothetical protein
VFSYSKFKINLSDSTIEAKFGPVVMYWTHILQTIRYLWANKAVIFAILKGMSPKSAERIRFRRSITVRS